MATVQLGRGTYDDSIGYPEQIDRGLEITTPAPSTGRQDVTPLPLGVLPPQTPEERRTSIGDLVRGDYQTIGGRAPTAAELQSETENYEKYGGDQLRSNLRARFPGGGGASGGAALPPNQFDDAYTSMLENISKAQMGEVRSNPALDSLLGFLTKRFGELSTTPGYGPDELALLNTQAFEPIEANRKASSQRSLERTAARGFLPSSGLAELDLRDIDERADRARTQASRDLAINAIGKRDADLDKALDLGQLAGLTIPRSQRGEELGLANLLYQLPRTALQDAMSVVRGSPSGGDAFQQALQLLGNQQQQSFYSQQQNSAIAEQIGRMLAGVFGQ